MKLIICHLGRTHNIHQRSASSFHLAEEDLRLGNLKFIPKGEADEVFGMPIPNELIPNNIKNTPYYSAYLMDAKHDRKITSEKEGKKKPTTAKQPKPKPAKEKSSKLAPAPKPKSFFQLVNKPNEELAQLEPEPELEYQGEGEDQDVKRVIQMSLESFQAHSQAHVGGVAIRECVAEATRPLPVVEGKGKAIANEQVDTSTNIVRDSTSPIDAETSVDTDKTNSGGQAGSDPGKTPESRPPLEREFMNEDQARPDPGVSHVDLDGSNPEPTYEEFMANLYLDVYESLKFPVDERVILEEPLSSSETLSSMKNQDDAYTIRDQFLNEKLIKEEPGKLNVDSEVVSIVTVLIHQVSFLIPWLSTPIIDLSPSKPVSSTNQAPIFTATTTTTTTTLLLPPPLQQQIFKEAVHIALQALLRDRFRELPEAVMKEILYQRMFKSSSYKSLHEHVALYEALEASMKRANRDEFLVVKEKSCKRCWSTQPSAPQSLAWKSFDTRETPSSFTRQKLAFHYEQPIKDESILDDVNVSDFEDIDNVKEKQEKDKIGTKPDKNEKCGKAWRCQKPITVKKAEKRRKYKFKGPNMKILEVVFIQEQRQGLILQFTQSSTSGGQTVKLSKL
uniref:Histone deacetylase 14 n=1 Tax=Tanacetum cinerariifolium TaxID=118510 RepID=A0A699IAW9_TANCI|nr:hypothetical protein [Tanacetum cinerariifolium]